MAFVRSSIKNDALGWAKKRSAINLGAMGGGTHLVVVVLVGKTQRPTWTLRSAGAAAPAGASDHKQMATAKRAQLDASVRRDADGRG